MATAPDLVLLPNGERLARGVYNAYLALVAFARLAGYNVWVSSGYRTRATQVSIFVSRYRQQASGSGPYGDVKFWNGAAYGYPGGTRWVRISGDGTVAVPGTSLHEKASAVDFGGIPAGGASAFARWMRLNAPSFGFSPTGYNFGEAWHYDYTGNPWSGGGSNPYIPETPTIKRRRRDMSAVVAARDQGGHVYHIGLGFIKHLASPEESQAVRYLTDQAAAIQADELDFQRMIWGCGLQEYSMAQILALAEPAGKGGRYLTAKWLDSTKAPAATFSPEQITALAKAISAGVEAGATEAQVRAIVQAAFSGLVLTTRE